MPQAINTALYTNQIINRQEAFINLLKSVAAWETDDKFVFVSVSPKTLKMIGYSIDELLGRTPFDFMSQDEAEKLRQHLIELFPSPKPYSFLEVAFLKKDGQQIFMELTGIPLFNRSGIPSGYMCMKREITQLKQSEASLMNALTELEAKNNLLQELKSALKVVLRQKDDAADEMKLTILNNLRWFVIPYLDTIERTATAAHIKTLIALTKKNLFEITSQPFHHISSYNGLLSPTEAKIAAMIKEGMATKEIAAILNVSVRTITTHRYNIRKKLLINAKKASRPSHLRSSEY